MPTQRFPRVLLAGSLVLIPVAAAAAAKPFTGPVGWDHTVVATPTPALPRAQETWKKSDSEVLTYLSDAALSYDDIVAMVKKNLSDNGMRPSYDKDRTCDGKRAHEVELTFGTTVVRQIIIDDAPGVTKLTYTRTQGSPQSPDELAAISAYCGP
jgi:hypothetical protein